MNSRVMLLWWLQHEKGQLICNDDTFNYYHVQIDGFLLMYRKRRFKPDGRRGFYLTDSLAHCLGFHDLHHMTICLTTLQYWRRFTSVERLQVAFSRLDDRRLEFRRIAETQGFI